MNYKLKFLFILIIMQCFQSCKPLEKMNFTPADPKSVPMLLDGHFSEWKTPFYSVSSQLGIKYRTVSDSTYLYLALHITDEPLKVFVLQQGLTVYIDTLGKKQEKFGVEFPLPLQSATLENLNVESRGDEQKFFSLYGKAFEEFELIGLTRDKIRASNLTSRETKAVLGFDALKHICLEYRFSLKQIYKNNTGFDGKIIQVGIIINEPKTDGDLQNDSGLFNDRTQNTLTQSNPMLGPSPNQQQFTENRPRQVTMPFVWFEIQIPANPNQ